MNNRIARKMQSDMRIFQTINKNTKKTYVFFIVSAIVVLYIAFMLCFLGELEIWSWIIVFGVVTMALIAFFFMLKNAQRPKCFCGEIVKIAEEWKRVPVKGSGAFGRSHLKTCEVRELQIAIIDERKDTHVIFCPSQYEQIFKIGDTVLSHSALPYPAHLSNLTKCLCMHCGTMQSATNETCITCEADIYSWYTLK